MTNERERFGRVVRGFAPPDDAFERLVDRRGRKQRNQRLAGAGGAVGVVVALAIGIFLASSPAPTDVPADPPEPTPVISAPTMWPQSSLEEVRLAQEGADAGDPDYTWQVDAQLYDLGTEERFSDGRVELVDRFLREELGWEDYVWTAPVIELSNKQTFLRCAPGRTNPLYPPGPGPEVRGQSCAPTIDDLTYEMVGFDLVQPDREGPDAVWVVSGVITSTFDQVDPAVAEAQATERLEEFLAARVAGHGAEGYVDVYADWVEPQVPLLYATASGSPYVRSEFERVAGPQWPYGGYVTFRIRLFTEDGSVVEQEIYSHWDGGRSVGIYGGLALGGMTTLNGGPVFNLFEQFDGEVTYWSPEQNQMDVGDDGLIDFTDPAVFWSECAGGPVPTDAAGIARAVGADPNFESTVPVAGRVGGAEAEAVVMDVALAPGGSVCDAYRSDSRRWIHALEPGTRLRLYLVDLPAGMSIRTLAITVRAPEEHFEDVLAAAAPIIGRIEFHPG
jgi:hypothetical protein